MNTTTPNRAADSPEARAEASPALRPSTRESHSGSRRRSQLGGSLASQLGKKSAAKLGRGEKREETIVKNIQNAFKQREAKMVEKIIETIWDDKLRVYKLMRKDWEERLNELDKERAKITRKKKNKKEKGRQLLRNTIEKVNIICIVLK